MPRRQRENQVKNHYRGADPKVNVKSRPAGRRARPKDLNARAVKANRSQSVGELVRRLQAADERLRGFGTTLDPQDVVLEVQSHLHTLEGAIGRIEAHIRNHHRKLLSAPRLQP